MATRRYDIFQMHFFSSGGIGVGLIRDYQGKILEDYKAFSVFAIDGVPP